MWCILFLKRNGMHHTWVTEGKNGMPNTWVTEESKRNASHLGNRGRCTKLRSCALSTPLDIPVHTFTVSYQLYFELVHWNMLIFTVGLNSLSKRTYTCYMPNCLFNHSSTSILCLWKTKSQTRLRRCARSSVASMHLSQRRGGMFTDARDKYHDPVHWLILLLLKVIVRIYS